MEIAQGSTIDRFVLSMVLHNSQSHTHRVTSITVAISLAIAVKRTSDKLLLVDYRL